MKTLATFALLALALPVWAAERVSTPVTIHGPGSVHLTLDINAGVIYDNPQLHGCIGFPPPAIDASVSVQTLAVSATEGFSSIDLLVSETASRTQTYCVTVDGTPLMVTPGGSAPTPPTPTPPTPTTCPPGMVQWLCDFYGFK